MKFLLAHSSLLVLGVISFWVFLPSLAWAQTAVPARPVDPNQAVPVQSVGKTSKGTGTKPVQDAGVSSASASPADAGPELSILADSSLKNVLSALAQSWADTQPDGPQIPITLTNAGTMATQVQSHPAWDVVIGADATELKTLSDKGLLNPDAPISLARNTLVIYGRKALLKDDDPDWFDLVGTEWKKVAMGNPDLVESGRVAKRALQKHDLFDDDHKDIYVKAGTEVLAMQIVERDQADAVFIYRTDLPQINLPGFAPMPIDATDAPPIFYLAATGRLAKNPDGAHSFVSFISSEAARPIWTKFGFEMN